VIYLCQRLLAVIGATTTADHPPYRAFYLNRRPSEEDKPSSTKETRRYPTPVLYNPMIWICELSDNLGIYRAAGNQQTPGINVALIVTISSGSW
jgi:hypothetical protein